MVDFSTLPHTTAADTRGKRAAKALVKDLVAVRCRDVAYERKRITGLPGGGVLTVTGSVRGDVWDIMRTLRSLESTMVTGWAGQLRKMGNDWVVVIPQDSFVELMSRMAGGEEDDE